MSHNLDEKIVQIQKNLEEKTAVLELYKEELMRTYDMSKNPTESGLHDVPTKVFSEDISDILTLDTEFLKNVKRMEQKSEKLTSDLNKILY